MKWEDPRIIDHSCYEESSNNEIMYKSSDEENTGYPHIVDKRAKERVKGIACFTSSANEVQNEENENGIYIKSTASENMGLTDNLDVSKVEYVDGNDNKNISQLKRGAEPNDVKVNSSNNCVVENIQKDATKNNYCEGEHIDKPDKRQLDFGKTCSTREQLQVHLHNESNHPNVINHETLESKSTESKNMTSEQKIVNCITDEEKINKTFPSSTAESNLSNQTMKNDISDNKLTRNLDAMNIISGNKPKCLTYPLQRNENGISSQNCNTITSQNLIEGSDCKNTVEGKEMPCTTNLPSLSNGDKVSMNINNDIFKMHKENLKDNGDITSKCNSMIKNDAVVAYPHKSNKISKSHSTEDGAVIDLKNSEKQATPGAERLTSVSATNSSQDDPKLKKYTTMIKVGVPLQSVVHKMEMDNVSKSIIELFKSSNPSRDASPMAERTKINSESMKDKLLNDPVSKKYVMMKKVGVPLESVLHKMKVENISTEVIQNFQYAFGSTISNHIVSKESIEDTMKEKKYDTQSIKERLMIQPNTKKYITMTKVGVPVSSVLHKMIMEDVSKENIQHFKRAFGLAESTIDEENKSSDEDCNNGKVIKTDDNAKLIKERLVNDPEIKKYVMMMKVGVPIQSVIHKMETEQVSKVNIKNFQRAFGFKTSNHDESEHFTEDNNTVTLMEKDDEVKSMKERLMNDPVAKKYMIMTKVGVPLSSVLHKMEIENVPKEDIQKFQSAFGLVTSNHDEAKNSVKHNDSPVEMMKKDDDIKLMKENLMNNPVTKKYLMMTKVGVPLPSVLHKMEVEKVSKENIQLFQRAFGVSSPHEIESFQSVRDNEAETNNNVKLQKIYFNTPPKEKLQHSLWAINSDASNTDDNTIIDQDAILQLESYFKVKTFQPIKRGNAKKSSTAQSNRPKTAPASTMKEINLIDMKRANNIAIALAQYRSFSNYDELCCAVSTVCNIFKLKKKSILDYEFSLLSISGIGYG